MSFRTDARCGLCGEWLRGEQIGDGNGWRLACGCGSRVPFTTKEWIELEFCAPFAGAGEPAPVVRAQSDDSTHIRVASVLSNE